jgi:PAS domain S-box-containing protein
VLYYEGTAEDITARKQTEEALRLSEERFAKAFLASPNGIVISGIVDGQIVEVNDSFVRMFGYAREELMSSTSLMLNMFVNPDDRKRAVQQLLEEGQVRDFELDVRRKSGEVRHASLSSEMIHINGQAHLLTILNDITERKRIEDAERVQRARAEALVRVAARLNAQLNLDAVLNAVCEETAHALNVAATSVTLYDEKRTEFDHAATFGMPPAYRARAKPFPRPLFDKYAAQMGPIIVGPDVQAIPELPNADLYQALDIRTVIGATMQRDGQLIGGLNLFTFHQVRHFDDDELALLKGLADQAALAIANARLHDEVRRHAAELEQKVAERTAELTQRETALRVANEQLQQLSRLKSEFVSNVSHELRTPLANIMTYLWLLDHGKPDKRVQYMETLNREAELLKCLIEDLLHLSRLDLSKTQPALAPMDVNRLVTLLVGDRSTLFADRGLTLEAHTAPHLPLIQADEKMLIQVLTNLMTNAMNYTPAGGAVTVSTRREWESGGVGERGSGGAGEQGRIRHPSRVTCHSSLVLLPRRKTSLPTRGRNCKPSIWI